MWLDRLITLHVAGAPATVSTRVRPVLMYHRLAEPARGDDRARRLCTPPARFAEQLRWLADAGWHATSVTAALASPGERVCALTFDDGFRDAHEVAAPALAAHDFHATFYLATSFIGDARHTFQGHECLTWHEARALHQSGHEIGSHTVTHPRLGEFDWALVRRELASSKAVLEDQLAAPITGFSCPFGFPQAERAFIHGLALLLRACGYAHAVTTVIGRAARGDNPLLLPRLPIDGNDDRDLFLAKLEGRYDWMGRPQLWTKQFRHFARQLAPA